MNTKGEWVLETQDQPSLQEGWVLETPQNATSQEQEEGLLSKAARYPMQVVKAAPYLVPGVGVADLALSLEAGGAKQETLNDLEDLYSRGLLKENEYNEAVQKVSSQDVARFAPTLHNLYSLIEDKTGIPLEAKTKLQQLIELGSTAAAMHPGTVAEKAISAISVPAAKESFLHAGAPEPVANLLSGLFADPKSLAKLVVNPEFLESEVKSGSTGVKAAIQEVDSVGNKIIGGVKKRVPRMPKVEPETEISEIGVSVEPVSSSAEKIASGTEGGKQVPKPSLELEKVPSKKITGAKVVNRPAGAQDRVKIEPTDTAPFEKRVRTVTTDVDYPNSTVGGKDVQTRISAQAKTEYQAVRKAYDDSKRAMSTGKVYDRQLNDDAEILLSKMGAPTPMDSSTTNKMREWLHYIAKTENLSSQQKIDFIQEIHRFADFDLPHAPGQAKKVFYQVEKILEDSINRTSSPESLELWNKAKTQYAQFQDKFSNKTISSIRKRSNKNYSNIFNNIDTVDAYRHVDRALGSSKNDNIVRGILKKQVIEKQMGKYIKNPELASGADFEKSIREVESILTDRESKSLRESFSIGQAESKIKRATLPESTKRQMARSEEISRQADSVVGAKDLKKKLSQVQGGEELYNEMMSRKAGEKLFSGKQPTASAMDRNLKDVETRRWLKESFGEKYLERLDELSSRWNSYEDYIKKYGDPSKKRLLWDIMKDPNVKWYGKPTKWLAENWLHPEKVGRALDVVFPEKNLPNPKNSTKQ